MGTGCSPLMANGQRKINWGKLPPRKMLRGSEAAAGHQRIRAIARTALNSRAIKRCTVRSVHLSAHTNQAAIVTCHGFRVLRLVVDPHNQ